MANPWSRQRNEDGELEPMRWFSRFEQYRLMGPTRSLLAVYNAWRIEKGSKVSTGTPVCWQQNAERWHWQARAEAWDETILQHEREEWAARRKAWKEREWDMASQLLDRAVQMLRFPLAQVTRTGENGETTMVMPADWKASDVRAYAESASKLARLAAELNTEQVQVNVGDIDSAIENELARLAGLAQADDAGEAENEADADSDDGSSD